MKGKNGSILLRSFLIAVAVLFVAAYANPAIAKVKVLSVSGQVVTLDNAAKALTVKAKKGEVTIAADQMTKVAMGKKKKTFEDLKVGDKVTVTYHEKENKSIANSISIKSLPAKMHEKGHAGEQVHG